MLGLLDPTQDAPVRFALKRMARALGTRSRQAAPLGEDDARLLLRTAGDTPLERRDLALLLVMRDLLARRSEVVALDVADLAFDADGSATAIIRHGKTDQAGEGATRWLAAAGIREGAVFRVVNKAGRAGGRLGAPEVSQLLKQLAIRAWLDPAAVSGHSPRVGMAQDLIASGADLAGVMQAGRWKSPTMPALRRAPHRQARRRGSLLRGVRQVKGLWQGLRPRVHTGAAAPFGARSHARRCNQHADCATELRHDYRPGKRAFSACRPIVPERLVCGMIGYHCPGLMRTMSTNARKGAGT